MLYMTVSLAFAVLITYCRTKLGRLKSLGTHQIPSLINATSDQLNSGLEKKRFTSVDLVNVSHSFLSLQRLVV